MNHVFLQEQLKKLPEWESPHAKTMAWSNDMEGHTQKCVERYCELANKKAEPLYKVSSPCLDDHPFKKKELESVGELSEVCSQIVESPLSAIRPDDPQARAVALSVVHLILNMFSRERVDGDSAKCEV